jgi:hypothetical protein
MKNEKDAYEGEWDFDGSCAPGEDGSWSGAGTYETFTLGCFQWVRRGKDGRGVGLKKGKVMYRIKGYVSAPKAAYLSAREYCLNKNAQQALRKIEERSDTASLHNETPA